MSADEETTWEENANAMSPHVQFATDEQQDSVRSNHNLLKKQLNANSARNINSFFSTSRSVYSSQQRVSSDASAVREENGVGGGDGGGDATAHQAETVHRQRCVTKLCGIMERFPIAFVLCGAAFGIALGIGLSFWNPEDTSAKEITILWVGLLGNLFLRALKCVILPLVFVSIAISVMDMLSLGSTGKVVGTTLGLYLCTTICAATIACIVSKLFSNLYINFDTMDPTSGVGEASVRIGCSIDEFGNPQSYLTQESSGMVTCIDNDGTGNETIFSMLDINGYFKVANPGPAKLSLSQTIYEGIFMKLIGENMMALFTDSNFLGVIILASGFGVALHQLTEDMPPEVNWSQILTVQLLEELAQIFVKFILWIIKLTPFAVVSLVAAAIGAQSDLGEVFSKIGYLCAAVAVGLFLQFALVYCSLYFSFLRKSPLSYFKHLIPALTMAFASASSAATIPLSISCAVKSGEVPLGVASFVIPLGATVNQDGGAIYIISACIWLAYENGITPTAVDYIILAISATLGSIGSAPVPMSSLVMTMTVYSTAFGGGATPNGLAYLFAVDWILDRLRTTVNVTGDLLISAIVAHRHRVKDTHVTEREGEIHDLGN